jgi:NAD(P)-dependent dehydrogenase (short-subunit alcohol dehydrogenase family)
VNGNSMGGNDMSAQNVLVTGTSSGFGFLIARSLAEAGHNVLAGMRDAIGRNREPADQLIRYGKDAEGMYFSFG